MSARTVTVNEVLGGHAVLDIECLDRVYLNAYVPIFSMIAGDGIGQPRCCVMNDTTWPAT